MSLIFDFPGVFTQEMADQKKLHLARGEAGSIAQGCLIHFFLLVDPEDGVIVDATFQCYGSFEAVLAMEALAAFCQRKTYVQASHVTSEILQKEVKREVAEINVCLEALDEAVDTCLHIEPIGALQTPMPLHDEVPVQIEGFFHLPKKKQKQTIELILDEKIRPYIEMDAGGLEVIDLRENVLLVRYLGACTTCPSSIGGTLGYIEKTLQLTIDPNIEVRPVFEE